MADGAGTRDGGSRDRRRCGGSGADQDLSARLTPLQYAVTQCGGTEPPFQNEYWDEHRDGIYVDVVDGTPLFSSRDKFDSGTGWPSFTRPLAAAVVTLHEDRSHGMRRTEVRAAGSGAHLGHVFPDGPPPTGLRYCMNSAALRFVPVEDLEKEGYGEYRRLFGQDPGGGGAAPAAGGTAAGEAGEATKQP